MRNAILLTAVMVTALLLSACSIHKSETGSAVSVQNLEETAATETEEGDPELMGYDFKQFKNVNITGIDLSSLGEEELAILYTQARYCQAMTEADIDTMRELVSEDMVL